MLVREVGQDGKADVILGKALRDMGNGVLVYFDYPQAREDDAERAVRAGLELIGAVGALKASAPLQTRVSIAAGLVAVDDLVGSGARRSRRLSAGVENTTQRCRIVLI